MSDKSWFKRSVEQARKDYESLPEWLRVQMAAKDRELAEARTRHLKMLSVLEGDEHDDDGPTLADDRMRQLRAAVKGLAEARAEIQAEKVQTAEWREKAHDAWTHADAVKREAEFHVQKLEQAAAWAAAKAEEAEQALATERQENQRLKVERNALAYDKRELHDELATERERIRALIEKWRWRTERGFNPEETEDSVAFWNGARRVIDELSVLLSGQIQQHDQDECLLGGTVPAETDAERHDETPEICICAAIRLPDGEIFRGHRHDDAIHTAGKAGVCRSRIFEAEQGFVTSRNQFVGRQVGAQLQRAAGIVSAATGQLPEGSLFSEDLYLRPRTGAVDGGRSEQQQTEQAKRPQEIPE